MSTVVVVGAGIAGLSAARRLLDEDPALDVIVLEAADHPGGKLVRRQIAGEWIDVGAESVLARRPEALALFDRLGLNGEVRHPNAVPALLRNRGTNRRLPAGTVLGVPADLAALPDSGLLSQETLRLIAGEAARAPVVLDGDTSVGDLVADRFGEEVVQRLVDPLLGGVYAGHAHEISLRAAMPALARQFDEGARTLTEATARTAAAGTAPPGGPVFASLADGLARLPEHLAAGLDVRCATTVRQLHRTPSGFRIVTGSRAAPEALDADAVVVAVPAAKAAVLLADLAPGAGAELAGIDYASMAIVTLAFDGGPAALGLPSASGVLIPAVEGLASKAMTFSSVKWPGLGGKRTLLRASLGRAHEERDLQRPDDELVGIVRRELALVAGALTPPVDVHVQRWGAGLPQYAPGHLGRVARIRAAVAEVSGLAVCGAAYDGVGIAATIGSAHTAADQVLRSISQSAQ
ncbi:protoporphyrinogen oxidase [Jatrophihabitans telluris]|uniref:Coproporphyrinogen III oxidase n=1 Tax=Jatrophihabitans telluris TaxID=2038343 RepID=A0ABY4QSW0_9ACTN|nr:protoporphyrinogen oxidase [Jatrophihabitans telluris]UQX86687.1 protoporphyrinogen oxidase [Jatrophihabitans telluris]